MNKKLKITQKQFVLIKKHPLYLHCYKIIQIA